MPVPKPGESWTDDEIRAAVDAYLIMLEKQARGETFVKSEIREAIAPYLPSRSSKAIELKWCNISAVLEERAHEFFELGQPDPFMTLAPRVRPEKASLIPAAVHVDGTARVQTVSRSSNPRYYDVIEAFGRLTGVPILINTSFNKQEPIVARPEEAVSCFLRTDMDVLVLGDFYTTDRPTAAMQRARAEFQVIEANLYGGE